MSDERDVVRRSWGGRLRRVGTLLFGSFLVGGCHSGAPPEGDVDRRAAVEGMFQKISAKYSEVPVIDRAGVAASDRVILVDVRPDEERRVAVIPGSISGEEFEARRDVSEHIVVAYCTVGERSGRYAAKLRARGIDARNLWGGILGWVHEGGTLVDESGVETKRAHVYGERWNLLPPEWEGITR